MLYSTEDFKDFMRDVLVDLGNKWVDLKNNWRGCLERYSIMEEKVENLESLLNYIIKELVETKDKVNVTYEV